MHTLYAESGGRSHLGVAQDANERAMKHGMHLAGLVATVWPANDINMKNRLEAEVLEEAFLFAYSARKVLDFEKVDYGMIKFPDITVKNYWNLKIDGKINQIGLRQSCNKLIHSDHAVVLSWVSGTKNFPNFGDRYISLIEVTADGAGPYHIDPHGLFFAYLDRKSFYPEKVEP